VNKISFLSRVSMLTEIDSTGNSEVWLDIPSAAELTSLASLLSPGVIILWVRGRFKDTIPPKIGDQLISFALISVAYSAAVYPLFHAESGLHLPEWLWRFLISFLVPLIIAILVIFFDRSEQFYKLTQKFGLRPAHHEPTAWDYAYRNRQPSYVLVHLTDGTSVAGTWDDGAFASSTAGDRDLLVSRLWKVEKNGSWTVVEPARAMLICGGSIRMVEFIDGGQS
jgi:Family of unknown function (DUF6338)